MTNEECLAAADFFNAFYRSRDVSAAAQRWRPIVIADAATP
jgi:hypothetical protein